MRHSDTDPFNSFRDDNLIARPSDLDSKGHTGFGMKNVDRDGVGKIGTDGRGSNDEVMTGTENKY